MRFELNRPVTTREPTVVVDGTLAVGVNRFRLEVVDESGNRSKPTEVDIIVTRLTRPPIVRDPIIVTPIPRDPTPIDPTRIRIRRPN